MLAERLLALTALAGRMVVVAAATDEWETARRGFAQLLGRGDVKQTRLTEAQLQGHARAAHRRGRRGRGS